MARPEIGSIRDLRGKKLAVSGFGGASHQRMLIVLRSAGLDPQKDVNIISVGDAALRMDQLRLGAIDATVLTAPHCFVAERAGFKNLGSSKDTLPLPAVGLVTLERKIKERPDQVKKVIRTVLRGMKYLRENREESVRVAIEWLSIDRDLAERSYDIMLPNYSYDGTIAMDGLKASIDLIAARSAGTSRLSRPAIAQTIFRRRAMICWRARPRLARARRRGAMAVARRVAPTPCALSHASQAEAK